MILSKRIGGNTAKLALTGFCLMIFIAACQRADEQVADAKEKVVDAKGDVAEANQELTEATRNARAEWQENWLSFKRDIDKEVADNERRILDLRNEVAHIDAQHRDGYNTTINEAERRNNELRDRVNNYTDEGDAKWEVFKTDIRRDFDALGESVRSITIKND